MIRMSIIAVLFLSVFVMIKGIAETWKDKGLADLSVPAATKKITALAELPTTTDFNPVVPELAPDLNPGYLFNVERILAEEEVKTEGVEEELIITNDLGIKTNIADVSYSGSIIGDTFKKAIIAYTPKKEAGKKSKSSRTRTRKKSSRSAQEHARLAEGDVLSGYLVASIDMDKIIFTKGEETVEKFLYDPEKKRIAPPVVKAAPKKGAPGRPGPPGSAPAGTPRRPAAAPGTSPRSAETGGAAPKPARRTARTPSQKPTVTRKPPTKPNTSRVVRRRRSSGSAGQGTTPAPPFMQR